MLSVQKIIDFWSTFRTVATEDANRNPRIAPISSSPGILLADSGATLLFDTTKRT